LVPDAARRTLSDECCIFMGPHGLKQPRDGTRPHACFIAQTLASACSSSSAHLRWCGTSYTAVSAAREEEPAGVPLQCALHLHAELPWLLCAAGNHAVGAATGRRWLPPLAEAPQLHPRMLSNAVTPSLTGQYVLGMPKGALLPGARAGGPSGRAPAAHGPCVCPGRRPPASGLGGCAMDGGAAGTAEDGTVVLLTRTRVAARLARECLHKLQKGGCRQGKGDGRIDLRAMRISAGAMPRSHPGGLNDARDAC